MASGVLLFRLRHRPEMGQLDFRSAALNRLEQSVFASFALAAVPTSALRPVTLCPMHTESAKSLWRVF